MNRRAITTAIMQMMETSGINWVKPWTSKGMPMNPLTNRAYRGINTVILGTEAHLRQYPSNEWASYVQWRDKDCLVRKGEHGTQIVVFNIREMEDGTRKPFFGHRVVFNASQVEGYIPVPKRMDFVSIEEVEQMTMMVGADIRHGGDRAYYHPKFDFIGMPDPTDFHDDMAYYATLFHELGHWTGHESRCHRDMQGKFGDPEYAMEELIAELTSAFLCADYGISAQPRADHAQYLNNWMRMLRDNDNAIFHASSQARQASEFIHARAV